MASHVDLLPGLAETAQDQSVLLIVSGDTGVVGDVRSLVEREDSSGQGL